jgi:mannose-1-phosphate guanylyltransferase
MPTRSAPWAVVLAGGQGARMRAAIRGWLGEDRPKQYCTFTGTRSLLDHTASRAASVVGGDRVIIVISPGHRAFISDPSALRGRILEQPYDRGTAFAVYFTLAAILTLDPDADVLLLPSDHFIRPESAFVTAVSRATELTRHYPDSMILLGVEALGPETDFGWIEPEGQPAAWERTWKAGLPARVMAFHEKPPLMVARRLFRRGCLWSTFIVVGKARTLWDAGYATLGGEMARFEALRRVLVPGHEVDPHLVRAVSGLYEDAPRRDFSVDVLSHLLERLLVMPLRDVEWSDWGRPERVDATLRRMGRPAVFAGRPAPTRIRSTVPVGPAEGARPGDVAASLPPDREEEGPAPEPPAPGRG